MESGNVCKTLVVTVTTVEKGGVSGHCYWHLGVEPRDALKPPTMHRLAPNDKGYQPKTLMVSALRNPNLDICSSRFLVLEEKASTHKGVT